jgi:D-arginine dehydrogenase
MLPRSERACRPPLTSQGSESGCGVAGEPRAPACVHATCRLRGSRPESHPVPARAITRGVSEPSPPIVIVGAGLAGAATAYHLRLLGVDDVLLLEKERLPGMHASGRNAAMLREQMDDPRLQELARASVRHLRSGELADFHRTGSLLLGRGSTPAADYIPDASGQGAYHPDDGVDDVAGLLQRYLRGAQVRCGCEVQAVAWDGEAVRLDTTQGLLRARVLVNAAGPWAGQIGGLPLTPLKRHLFTSAPDPGVDPDRPWLWDLEHGYYVRPESGGLLLCACDEIPSAPGDYRDEPAVLQDLLQKLAVHQPGWAEPQVIRHWTGQRTFAPDRLPVIGFDARRPWLFHVAGLGGHGVTLSHSVGALAAGLLCAGPATEDAEPAAWSPRRFPAPGATSPLPADA